MKEGILQKVRHELSAVLSSEGTLAQAVGLAFFFAWNLTDIYADPFIGSGEMMSEPMRLHVVSSLCNACGYLIAMLLFSRSGSFRGIVCGSSGLAGAATVGLYALSAWGWMEAQTALLLYRGVTRLCSACVVVAWGMCYSRLEPHELTMRALMAFVFAALGYLLLDALAGRRAWCFSVPFCRCLLCCFACRCAKEAGLPSVRLGRKGRRVSFCHRFGACWLYCFSWGSSRGRSSSGRSSAKRSGLREGRMWRWSVLWWLRCF